MRKVMGIMVMVVCWMMCVLPVKADIIWEPYEDAFYMEHQMACVHLERVYTANGPDGKVITYKSPENPDVVESWENGYEVCINYTYTDEDGIVWGLNGMTSTGWVPMEYMELVYDNISFAEEFEEKIVEEDGSIPAQYAGMNIYAFSYPGAEKYIEINVPGDKEAMLGYDMTFVDEAGYKWGHINYFRGIRDVWVCLDNATADATTLYPDGLPERGVQSGPEDDVSAEDGYIMPKKDNGLVGIVICMVVAVVGVTGGALVIMKKRGK